MPEMDGMDFLAAVREQTRDLGVILVTGFGSIETAVEAMRRVKATGRPAHYAMKSVSSWTRRRPAKPLRRSLYHRVRRSADRPPD